MDSNAAPLAAVKHLILAQSFGWMEAQTSILGPAARKAPSVIEMTHQIER